MSPTAHTPAAPKIPSFPLRPKGTILDVPATSRARTPRFIRRLTRALLLMIVALPVALLAIPWQQNVRGEGRVVAYAPLERQQNIEAPISGVVQEWFVAEGTRVGPGDPLFRMSDVDPLLLKLTDCETD